MQPEDQERATDRSYPHVGSQIMEQDPGIHHIEVVRTEGDDREGMKRRLGENRDICSHRKEGENGKVLRRMKSSSVSNTDRGHP